MPPDILQYETPQPARRTPWFGWTSKAAFFASIAMFIAIGVGYQNMIMFIVTAALPLLGVATGITGLIREPDERAAADGFLLNMSLLIAIGGFLFYMWYLGPVSVIGMTQ